MLLSITIEELMTQFFLLWCDTGSPRYTSLRYMSFQFYIITKLLPKFQYMSLKTTYIEELVRISNFFTFTSLYVGSQFTSFSICVLYQLEPIATDIKDCLYFFMKTISCDIFFQELLSQLEDNIQNVSAKALSSDAICNKNQEKLNELEDNLKNVKTLVLSREKEAKNEEESVSRKP